MEPEDRAAIESALAYPEETAGRLMSRDFVAVPEHLTVGDLIDFLRDGRRPADRILGSVRGRSRRTTRSAPASCRGSCARPRHVALTDVMKRDQTLIPVDDGPGRSRAALPEIRADLAPRWSTRAGGWSARSPSTTSSTSSRRKPARTCCCCRGAGDGDINEPIREAYFSARALADRQPRHRAASPSLDHRRCSRARSSSWWRWPC